MTSRALFLIPSDYEEIRRKGVTSMVESREQEGPFERVITVHPWAHQNRVIDITPVHRLYEIAEFFLPYCRGVKVLRYPHHVFHIVKLLWKIARLIDQERIDFIRATDPAFTGLLAWLVTRVRRRPFCISIHADYDKRFELDSARGALTVLGSRAIARRLEAFTLSRADLVLPIRPSLAEKAIKQGASPEKIRVIPHGIALEPFRSPSSINIRDRLGLLPDVPILSFVGRLSKDNYIYDLLDLSERLRKLRRNFILVVVGDGEERSAFKEAIRRQSLTEWVKFLGFQPPEYVVALRQASAVSLCLMAGFSLIEACAAGRPAVAYDVEWHAELVKNRITGCLIPERDLDALQDAVVYLLDHPGEAARMGQAAQALAFEHHDIRKTSALKNQYYQEILNRRPPHVA